MSTAAAPRTRIAGHRARCKCSGCFTMLARYRKTRELALARGTWVHPVPVEEVTARLRRLLAAGWTAPQIAYAAHLSPVYVRILLGEGSKPPPTKVRPATARAIAALGPQSRLCSAVPDSALVNPIGSIRRLAALAAIGWPQSELCRRLGLVEPPILQPDRLIAAGRARSIIALYDQLWDVPGPSRSAAIRARRRGGVPPAAWDEYAIDDPRRGPSGVADPALKRTRSKASRAYLKSEASFLAEVGLKSGEIAAQLEVSEKYVIELLGLWVSNR